MGVKVEAETHACRAHHFSRGPTLEIYLTPQPSGMSHFSATMSSNSPALNLAKPHFLERGIFWRPGSLNLALCRASITRSLFCSLEQMDILTWPMWTLATEPRGFPKAQDILLMRMTRTGWSHTRMGKPSLPVFYYVFIDTNTGSLQGFGGEPLVFI